MSRNYGGTMVANLFMKFGADTEEYQKKMRAAVTRMLFAAESLTQAGRIMSTAITAPMIAIGVASLKTAMEFESAMTRMVTLVGMPAETIEKWKPVVQDMAGIVGKSANELAEALFFITSNGIRTEQALDVLRATAMASAVGMGETKDIAIAATSALNAFGKGALTADESVAVLIGTVREGNLEAAELPQALSKLLPIAAAMGIEFHEAGAGIAAMSRSGTSARLAAFGLRAIMMGMLDPTASAAAAMAEVDMSSAKLKQTLAGPNGLRIALLQMKAATEDGNVTLKDLLPNQRAFSAALQLLGKNTQDYIDISKNMAEVVGEDVKKSFEGGADTMERTYKRAMGDLSSAAIDLGNNLSPMIDKFGSLAKSASKWARSYHELDDAQKGIVTGMGYALAATGPVLYALGSLARMMARFTGLSILFKASWVQNAAAMMGADKAATALDLKLKALNMTKLQFVAGLGTAAVAGWQFGKWLDKNVLKITENINKLTAFSGTVVTFGERLEDDEEYMNNAATAAARVAEKIGESGLAMKITQANQEGLAFAVAGYIEILEKKVQAYNKATIAADGLTLSEEEMKKKQDAYDEAASEVATEELERLAALRKTHGLLTSDEVTAKMNEMTGIYKDHKNAGVDIGLLNENQVDNWKEITELAKVYGLATTKSFKDIGESMMATGDLEGNEFYKLFSYYIPQAIEKIPGKVAESMIKVEKEGGIAKSLKGGMDKGFAEGLDNYSTNIRPQFEKALDATWKGGFTNFGDAMRDEINVSVAAINAGPPLQVAVVPDPEVFNNALHDLIDGNIPDTRG